MISSKGERMGFSVNGAGSTGYPHGRKMNV
jgi:hypothetical protein